MYREEEKKTNIFFIPLSDNKYLFTAADSEEEKKREKRPVSGKPASLPQEAELVCVCECVSVCVAA